MPTIRTLGTIIRVVARTIRATATGTVLLARFVGRGVLAARRRGAGGETGMIRLLDLHGASCAGDTLVAIGLAGTIFFTVPAGEARGRVALYLLVTMLPFALLAPVIGPVLDRVRHGRRYALATTMLGRAFLAYLVSEHIDGFMLYPAAFGILVLSRAYGVARSAAVPRLIPATLGLSEAGARASVFGTFAGALVVPVGLAAAYFGSPWALRVAAGVFVFGMVTALRLPPRADSDTPEVLPRVFRRPGKRGEKILSGTVVVSTVVGSASLRMMYGFLTLYLAFAIRSDNLPDDVLRWHLSQGAALGVVAAGLAVGSFVATAVGTALRIRRPTLVQACGISVATVAALVAAIEQTLLAVFVLCLAVAVASGLAKLAVDAVIQERVGERVRASAFAHSETLLMLAWVAGGALGLVPFTGRWGLIVVAGVAVLSAVRAVVAAVALRPEQLSGTPGEEAEKAAGPVPLSEGRGPETAKTGRRARRRQRVDQVVTVRPDRPRSEPTRSEPVRPDRPRSEPTRSDVVLPDAPVQRLPDWVDSNDIGQDDPDDTKISSPGFHLYRPSGLTGQPGLGDKDDTV